MNRISLSRRKKQLWILAAVLSGLFLAFCDFVRRALVMVIVRVVVAIVLAARLFRGLPGPASSNVEVQIGTAKATRLRH
jgi:hypothetical protein